MGADGLVSPDGGFTMAAPGIARLNRGLVAFGDAIDGPEMAEGDCSDVYG